MSDPPKRVMIFNGDHIKSPNVHWSRTQ